MLLSRTADNLFWMARYIERAESTARLLDVARRMASLMPDRAVASEEWWSAIEASGCEDSFGPYAGKTGEDVIRHLVSDRSNPSSIIASLSTVRQNARVVRTAISQDVWDAVNGMWIESQAWRDEDVTIDGLPRLLDWVKERSQRFGGACVNSMLRRDAYWWVRLGTFLERADNTARILDVKSHVLLPDSQGAGGHLDYYRWGAILHAVSAFRAYHWVYRNRLEPSRVAELMILRPEMPRSLLSCMAQVSYYLGRIAGDDGQVRAAEDDMVGSVAVRAGPMTEPLAAARRIERDLRDLTIAEVFAEGLHPFLTRMIERMNDLALGVRREHLMG